MSLWIYLTEFQRGKCVCRRAGCFCFLDSAKILRAFQLSLPLFKPHHLIHLATFCLSSSGIPFLNCPLSQVFLKYHYMLVRMAAIQKSTSNKCWRGCGEKGIILHSWWECKLVQPLWRTVWRFLKNLEIELPYDPAIPLLGKHTEETRSERDTCTPMFITALFIIDRTWKQPRCP